MDASLRDAAAAHEKLRAAVAAFHQTRAHTQSAILGRGSRKYSPAELAKRVEVLRMPAIEEEAAKGLRDYLQLLSGREPSLGDIERGLPPTDALMACASPQAALGGAWKLSSLFGYLADSERRLQRDLGIDVPGVATAVRRWAPPLVAVGAAAALGYVAYTRWKPNRPPMPGEQGSPPAPEIPEETEQ
jgi:hypothetical protein